MDNAKDIIGVVNKRIKYEILTHTLIKRLFGQDENPMTQANYVGLLVEIFHLIKYTPLYLTHASTHSSDDPWMRNFWMDFAVDERGHDQLCLADLRKMSLSEDLALKSMPGYGARAMVANNFFVGSRNPTDLIGFAAVTENLGVSIANELSSDIETRYPFTKGAASFLKVHGTEDVEHFDNVLKALDRCAGSSEKMEGILHTAHFTLHNYRQLFDDALKFSKL